MSTLQLAVLVRNFDKTALRSPVECAHSGLLTSRFFVAHQAILQLLKSFGIKDA